MRPASRYEVFLQQRGECSVERPMPIGLDEHQEILNYSNFVHKLPVRAEIRTSFSIFFSEKALKINRLSSLSYEILRITTA